MNHVAVLSEPLPSVYILDYSKNYDRRGFFAKPFHAESFKNIDPDFKIEEYFYSRSSFNVIRGMHYQAGSSPSKKLIYCSSGCVLDVIVDIRPDSPNYNKPFSFILDEHRATALLIGTGYAHGYLTLSNHADLHYLCDSVFDPAADMGILWSSIDFEWPTMEPILSLRDQKHPAI